MLGELFASWLRVLTRPSVETLESEKEGASASALLVALLLAGLVIGLTRVPLEGEPVSLLLRIVSTALTAIVEFVGLALILFFIAKIFGGEGSFFEHVYLLSLPVVPLVIAGAFLGRAVLAAGVWEPLAPLALERYVPVVVGVYGLFLVLLALQAAHGLRTSHAVNVALVALLIWIVLAVIAMFVAGADNVLTKTWRFIRDHLTGRQRLLDQLLQHIVLVIVSMLIAVILGVVIGVLITLPPRRPRVSHLWALLPLALFLALYLGATGRFGEPLQDAIRGVFRQASGLGLFGVVLVMLLYVLFLFGEHAAEAVLYAASILLTFPSIGLFGLFLPLFGIGFWNAAVALILYAQLPILRNTFTGIKEVPSAVIESARGMGMTEWQILYKIKLPMTVPVLMAGVRISMVMIVGIAAIAKLIGVRTLGKYIFDGIGQGSDPMVLAGAIGVSVFALLVDGLLGWAQKALTPVGLREERT